LVRYHVLFVIELSTRRIEVAGITRQPTSAWMMQVGRNLTDIEDGLLRDTRCLKDAVMMFGSWGLSQGKCANGPASARIRRFGRTVIVYSARPYLDPRLDRACCLSLSAARLRAGSASALIWHRTGFVNCSGVTSDKPELGQAP